MDVEDLEIYQESMSIGESVWDVVMEWDWFAKDTVGKQFVKSADSIAANISEGYERHFFAEQKRFYDYSRGSLGETLTWLKKAENRHLFPSEAASELRTKLKTLQRRLNAFIRHVEKQRNS